MTEGNGQKGAEAGNLAWRPSAPAGYDQELAVLNGHPAFNRMSRDRELMTRADLLEDIGVGRRIAAERYVVCERDRVVGIVEFAMRNPSDGMPWIGLLVVHRDHVGRGIALRTVRTCLALLRRRGADEVRLGVLKDNARAYRFWTRLGFVPYGDAVVDGKPIRCMRRALTDADA